jgi:hypothetical protein
MKEDDKIIEWIVTKIDRMDIKLDRLLESHMSFKWKVIGGSMMLSFLATLAVEFWRNKQ